MPNAIIETKLKIAKILSREWNSRFERAPGSHSLFSFPETKKRILVLVSMRHSNSVYWYAYSNEQRMFLRGGNESLMIFICRDDKKIFCIPSTKVDSLGEHMHHDANNRLHIHIDYNNSNLCMGGQEVGLSEYRNKLSRLLEDELGW